MRERSVRGRPKGRFQPFWVKQKLRQKPFSRNAATTAKEKKNFFGLSEIFPLLLLPINPI